MKRFIVIMFALLCSLSVASAQAQNAIFDSVGPFIMQQIPTLQSSVSTTDSTRIIYTSSQSIDTETCTIHRDEPTIATLKRHLICHRESSGGEPDLSFEEMYIGNTYFRKINDGPWMQYDKSSIYSDSEELTYFVPPFNNFWQHRQYTAKYAESEFRPIPTDTADRWYIQAQTFPMPFFGRLVEHLGHVQEVYSVLARAFFSNGPILYGTFEQAGENIGGFSMSGQSEKYDELTFALKYTQGIVVLEANATPKSTSFNTPQLTYQIAVNGLSTTALFDITYSAEDAYVIGYKTESTPPRPLEQPIIAPSDAVIATEKTLDSYIRCYVIQFKDICDHWSYDWMERARRVGYIGQIQYGDNPEYYLLPDQSIARTEFVRLMDEGRMYDLFPEEIHLTRPSWHSNISQYNPSDVDTSAWYIGDVQRAVYYGIAILQEGNRFRPNDTLNRAETMTFLGRVIDKSLGKQGLVHTYFQQWLSRNPGTAFAYFPDVSISSWYAPYVVFMADMGLLDRSQPRFRAGDPVTRAESITLIERLREAMPRILTSGL